MESTTPRFGLLGKNISHSGSPALFRAAYGGKYPYDLVDKDDFPSAWKAFMDGYTAVNVTAPFKEDAFRTVCSMAAKGMGSVSGPCFKIRAANLLVRDAEGVHAHNSDFIGVILSVAEAYFPGVVAQCYSLYGEKGHVRVHQFARGSIGELFGRKPQALVIGAGGAGRAAVVAAAELGFETAVMNRTASRARELCASLPEYSMIPVPVSDLRGAIAECDLVVYTASGPLDGLDTLRQEDFETAGRYGDMLPGKVLLEASYAAPSFGPALREAMAGAGCQYLGGERWLRNQALGGYSIMTGLQPDRTALMRAPLR